MKKRHEGIDLLRCTAMLMIIVLHIMNHGGILRTAVVGTTSYHGAWLMESAAYCAVNCYALITGYICIKTEHRYRRIVPLWLQVAFYSVVIALVQPLLLPGADRTPLLAALTPVIHHRYWYFTCYFGLFFLMPLINKGVLAMSRREAAQLLISLFLVFSVMSVLPYFNLLKSVKTEDVFGLGGGYSVLWLALMYVAGACIRLHGFGREIKGWMLLTGYSACVLVSWLFKLFATEDAPETLKPLLDSNALLYYPNLLTVIAAVCLLLLFSRLRELPPLTGKLVRLAAPSTFAIYLIHEHAAVRSGLIYKRFASLAADPPLTLCAKVFLIAVLIFLTGVLIDLGRRYLFRLLRVEQAVDALADRFVPED